MPAWAPFAVLGGLIAAPLIPEIAGPLLEGLFGAAAEGAGDVSSVDEVLAGLRAGRTPPNVEVDTPAELNRVFDELTEDGRPVESNNYPGKFVELQDGTRVGLRAGSRSGGPTIDVFKSDGTYVKVHLP
jgi:hypothetical protein